MGRGSGDNNNLRPSHAQSAASTILSKTPHTALLALKESITKKKQEYIPPPEPLEKPQLFQEHLDAIAQSHQAFKKQQMTSTDEKNLN